MGTLILRVLFIVFVAALGYLSGPILKTVISPHNSIIGGVIGAVLAILVILSIIWAKKMI